MFGFDSNIRWNWVSRVLWARPVCITLLYINFLMIAENYLRLAHLVGTGNDKKRPGFCVCRFSLVSDALARQTTMQKAATASAIFI